MNDLQSKDVDNNQNLKPCKACRKNISKKAHKCPHCGEDQRNFFMRHKFLTGIVVLIIIVFISDLGENNPSDTETSSNINPKSEKEAEEEIIDITAEQLATDYNSNEVKADDMYKGKKVRVTGTINDIAVVMNNTYITLNGGGDFDFISIQCFFKDKNEIEKIKELNKDEEITIIGKVNGMSLNVTVENSKIK